jgi:hypothetical protein
MTTSNFLECEDGDFAGGCPLMDFPTIPHYDSSPPGNPSDAAYFLRDPVLEVVGARTVSLTAASATATSSPVTVKNVGTGIGPFRVRTSAGWLKVYHPGETRHIDGGVALGSDVEVVTGKSPRVSHFGQDSVLQITVDPTFLEAGVHTGTVIIDTLLGNGATAVFNVTVKSSGGGGAGSGSPTPSPSASPTPQTYRAIVPNLTSEGTH